MPKPGYVFAVSDFYFLNSKKGCNLLVNFESIDQKIGQFLGDNYSDAQTAEIADEFHRFGVVKFDKTRRLVPSAIIDGVRDETDRLIFEHGSRRDLRLRTTGDSPRKMTVVRSELIETSELISEVAKSKSLLGFLGRIARERVVPEVSDDERFLITHQEFAADTHGWHWGDYSFALIWALRMPAISNGGMLQAVPHTHWDKSDPRINEILCSRQIHTYGLATGDLYLQRTDTTLHRTVPLDRDGAVRTILNMTWAAERDLQRPIVGNDRWWEDPDVAAARQNEFPRVLSPGQVVTGPHR
jgi:L-lysine 4-chlorinase